MSLTPTRSSRNGKERKAFWVDKESGEIYLTDQSLAYTKANEPGTEGLRPNWNVGVSEEIPEASKGTAHIINKL